ncbi:MAG TPA: hypothetical protein VFL17_12785, partial [Anaerolineae bacterium]|nr:hypothetical protein [Anaerolineae bacterium]
MAFHLHRDRTRALRRLALTSVLFIVATAAAVGVGRLAQARPQATTLATIFSENFEGGFGAWQSSAPPGSLGPRWNFVGSGSPYPKPAGGPTGPNAIWFGDPATGQYGGACLPDNPCPRYAGTLTYIGTPILVPSNETYVYMTFMSWELTEKSFYWGCAPGDFGTPYCVNDVRQVWISGTSDSTWRLKWNTYQRPIVEQVWRSIGLIDLSEYKGQSIRIRFGFDTVDGNYNPGPSPSKPAGWYVDNIQLFTFTPTDRVYLPLIRK